MHLVTRIGLTALLLVSLPVLAAQEFLSPEQAFPLTVLRASNGDVLLVFDVAPGYALYKDRITIAGDLVAGVLKPPGLPHEDEYFGRQEQYRGKAVIRVVPKTRWSPLELSVRSQGCADAGVCYNPQTRTLRVP